MCAYTHTRVSEIHVRQIKWTLLQAEHIQVRDSPMGIFGPWASWSRALASWESCWDAVAVAAAAAVAAAIAVSTQG